MDPTPPDARSRLAGGAYWATMKRVVAVAGAIDASWLVMYQALGAQALALLNVVSVAMYACAYWLITQRRNKLAITLVWTEVLAHSAIGSLLIGWDSGFHYFLLIFIPAIVVGSRRDLAIPMVGLLLAFYVGLDTLCARLGPLSPMSPVHLQIARWVNIALVFGLFFSMATFYRATVIRAERRLLEMATTDPLTGLANRSHFQQRAAAEIARAGRSGRPVALLLADVDHFKRINDAHGHDGGDKVLVKLAETLRTSLRASDIVGRWGGEEFIALLPDADEATAAALAERVRAAAAGSPVALSGHGHSVTLSFGVALCESIDDLPAATVRADLALYASKRAGRDRVTRASELAQADDSPGACAEPAARPA